MHNNIITLIAVYIISMKHGIFQTAVSKTSKNWYNDMHNMVFDELLNHKQCLIGE